MKTVTFELYNSENT